MPKVHFFRLAQELGFRPVELQKMLSSAGFHIRSTSTMLDEEVANRVREVSKRLSEDQLLISNDTDASDRIDVTLPTIPILAETLPSRIEADLVCIPEDDDNYGNHQNSHRIASHPICNIRIELSSLEAVAKLNDVAKLLIDFTGGITDEICSYINKMGLEYGVHQADIDEMIVNYKRLNVGATVKADAHIRIKAEYEKQKEYVARLQHELYAREKRYMEIAVRLDTTTQEKSQLDKELALQQEREREYQVELAYLHDQYNDLQCHLHQVRNERDSLEAERDEVKESLLISENTLLRLESQSDKMNHRLADAMNTLAKATAERDRAIAFVGEMKQLVEKF